MTRERKISLGIAGLYLGGALGYFVKEIIAYKSRQIKALEERLERVEKFSAGAATILLRLDEIATTYEFNEQIRHFWDD